jgi:hypothetical protein
MKRRMIGYACNALLRSGIAGFLVDVMRHPHDPRYEGKAIPMRNLVIVSSLSLAFPVLYLRGRKRFRWSRYPVWSDDLYLSIFWLDMAGNYFGLYDRYTHFDLIPHFHGSGALAGILHSAFGMRPRTAFGVANLIHAMLEAQEILTDVFFGTHNVRGWWDSAGDLSAGVLGTASYVGMSALMQARGCPTRDTAQPG